MSPNKEDTDTFEGQVYRDEMMNCDVKVTAIDDIAVYVRDVELLDEETKGDGSPYVWPMWIEAKDAGRFKLKEDVEHEPEGGDDTDDGDEEEEGSTGQEEEEATEEETEPSESDEEMGEFQQNEALSW